MWKGKYSGRDVAVKVIRTYSNSDLQKTVGVGCRLFSLSAWLCTETHHVEVL